MPPLRPGPGTEINDSELVPGQLQTTEYAEAVTLAAHPSSTRDELTRLVTVRRERQELLVGNRDSKNPTGVRDGQFD